MNNNFYEEIKYMQEFIFIGSQIDQSSGCSPEIVSNSIGLHSNDEHESSMEKQGY